MDRIDLCPFASRRRGFNVCGSVHDLKGPSCLLKNPINLLAEVDLACSLAEQMKDFGDSMFGSTAGHRDAQILDSSPAVLTVNDPLCGGVKLDRLGKRFTEPFYKARLRSSKCLVVPKREDDQVLDVRHNVWVAASPNPIRYERQTLGEDRRRKLEASLGPQSDGLYRSIPFVGSKRAMVAAAPGNRWLRGARWLECDHCIAM